MPNRTDADTRNIELHRLAGDGAVPNNPRLPLLVYRALVALGDDPAADYETLFEKNGWSGGWRNGIYPYHHFHSNAHEALGIARGEATVRFGGPSGPTVTVRAGDVVVIPAGIGHKNEGATGDLLVVGAYPEGSEPDMRRPDAKSVDRAAANVENVPVPDTDPVFGAEGPLLEHWRG